MAVYTAPGVYGRDVDLSQIVRNQSTSVGAIVGQARKGPANKRILFTNTRDVISLCGEPKTDYGYGIHSLLCSLEEMTRCYFWRTTKNAYYAGRVINKVGTTPTSEALPSGVQSDPPTGFLTRKTTLLGTGDGTTFIFAATLVPPVISNVVNIVISGTPNSTTIVTVYNPTTGKFAGQGIVDGTVDLSTGHLSVTLSTAPPIDYQVNVNFDYSDTTDSAFMIYAENPGEWGNSLKVMVREVAWDPQAFFIDVFETVQGIDLKRESWEVSRLHKKDGHGTQIYLEERINDHSLYIRVYDNIELFETTMPAFMTAPAYLNGGNDGDSINESDIVQAWQNFQNPSVVDVNILINAGYVSKDSWQVHGALQALAEMRRDCFAILDIPFDVTRMFPTTDARDWRVETQNINSNFCALYSPWIKVYDTYNDIRNLPIPPSGFVAQVFARTDWDREPWYAPAGYNRGIIVSQTLPPMDVTDRYGVPGVPGLIGELEALYENPSSINPIIFSPGDGIVVFGQKTLQNKPSALDRINVRRLVITTERASKQFLKYKLFELNNKFVRRDITSALNQYWDDIKARNGVYTYKVVCDETNNTPQVIDNNELHVDVYMQPQRAAEFIQLQSIITRTGVDFRVLIVTGGNF
jgi:phage tail sheath protein FI